MFDYLYFEVMPQNTESWVLGAHICPHLIQRTNDTTIKNNPPHPDMAAEACSPHRQPYSPKTGTQLMVTLRLPPTIWVEACLQLGRRYLWCPKSEPAPCFYQNPSRLRRSPRLGETPADGVHYLSCSCALGTHVYQPCFSPAVAPPSICKQPFERSLPVFPGRRPVSNFLSTSLRPAVQSRSHSGCLFGNPITEMRIGILSLAVWVILKTLDFTFKFIHSYTKLCLFPKSEECIPDKRPISVDLNSPSAAFLQFCVFEIQGLCWFQVHFFRSLKQKCIIGLIMPRGGQ